MAVLGAKSVPKEPHCALALAAAAVSTPSSSMKILIPLQVERAYSLWADGAITMESSAGVKGRFVSKAIIKTVNANTGRESSKDRAFTEANWGPATRNYLISIQDNLRPGSFDKIVAKAQSFMKHGRRDKSQSSQFGEMDEETDERAILVDISDDEGASVFVFDATLFIFYD
jgi:hypothetical protein